MRDLEICIKPTKTQFECFQHVQYPHPVTMAMAVNWPGHHKRQGVANESWIWQVPKRGTGMLITACHLRTMLR